MLGSSPLPPFSRAAYSALIVPHLLLELREDGLYVPRSNGIGMRRLYRARGLVASPPRVLILVMQSYLGQGRGRGSGGDLSLSLS